MREKTKNKKADKAVDLGKWLGRRQAFALVAGRCSAADAECIRRMREERNYRALAPNWDEFCKDQLGISRAWADRIIQHLNEFGPAYFLLAQVVKMTPDEFRKIRGAVRGQALLHAGEEIPIESENAGRLAAAIEELRRGALQPAAVGAANPSAEPADDKLHAEIERAFARARAGLEMALKQFGRLLDLHRDGRSRMRLTGELGYSVSKLRELEEASWRASA